MIYKNFCDVFLIVPLAKTVNLLEKNLILAKVSSNIGQGIVKQNTQLENILFSTSYNIVQDHDFKSLFPNFYDLKVPLKNIY